MGMDLQRAMVTVMMTESMYFLERQELESAVLCMKDTDQDGYGDSNPPEGITAGNDCNDSDEILNGNDSDGDGYTTCSGDCDENDELTYPGAAGIGLTDTMSTRQRPRWIW